MNYNIDRERWSKMNIFDQMGNISSEVGRSFSAKRRNDEDECMQAIARAIDLFDATTSVLIAAKSPKVKEVLRAKESFLATILANTGSVASDQTLEQYFMQFAIAARLTK